jgi:hypothetical protein
MVSIEESTSSGICSTPTARPCDPTMSAKQAVRYPVPEEKEKGGKKAEDHITTVSATSI